jgi:S-adenosylmethionine hydrolase
VAVVLFTDFGPTDLYVGQVELSIELIAPGTRVVHLLHEAPSFDVVASAHLLDALIARLPRGQVVLAVVDPGVGGPRRGCVVQAGGTCLVGPDNGLLSLTAQRYGAYEVWHLPPPDADAAPTFHGRDVFAPAAAHIVAGRGDMLGLVPAAALDVRLPPGDLAEVIYVDHYGNAFTGLRARNLPPDAVLEVGGRALTRARIFADRPAGEAFWYENSLGLVEIAVTRGSAARDLGLGVGSPVDVGA